MLVDVSNLRGKYGFDRVYQINERLRRRYMNSWETENPGKEEYSYEKLFRTDCSINSAGKPIGVNSFTPISAHQLIMSDSVGNGIYADCSIVEFDWEGIHQGFFYFDEDSLRYQIKITKRPNTSQSMFSCFDYDQYSMKDFKVIDTLQEKEIE